VGVVFCVGIFIETLWGLWLECSTLPKTAFPFVNKINFKLGAFMCYLVWSGMLWCYHLISFNIFIFSANKELCDLYMSPRVVKSRRRWGTCIQNLGGGRNLIWTSCHWRPLPLFNLISFKNNTIDHISFWIGRNTNFVWNRIRVMEYVKRFDDP